MLDRNTEIMKFNGVFRPPAVHVRKSPIEIAGPGRCSIGMAGLEVSGYQADKGTRVHAALVLALVAAAALALGTAADVIFRTVPPLLMQLAGGAIGGLIYFFVIAGREKHLADKPVALLIPWSNIAKAARDLRHPGGVVIEVRGVGPKGTIHFHPAGGTDDLLSALQRRG